MTYACKCRTCHRNVPNMLHANFANTIVFHSHIEKTPSKLNDFKHVYSLVLIENVKRISIWFNSIKYVTRMIFVATTSLIQINITHTLNHLFFAWVWYKFCREIYVGIANWSAMTINQSPSMANRRRMVSELWMALNIG